MVTPLYLTSQSEYSQIPVEYMKRVLGFGGNREVCHYTVKLERLEDSASRHTMSAPLVTAVAALQPVRA